MKTLRHKWIDVGRDEEKLALEASWKQQTLILNATQLKAVEKERTELSKLLKMLPECPYRQHVQTQLRALQLSLCSSEAQAVREIGLLLKVREISPEQEKQLQRAQSVLDVYVEPEKTPAERLFSELVKKIKKMLARF